jgi:hypothetical protein
MAVSVRRVHFHESTDFRVRSENNDRQARYFSREEKSKKVRLNDAQVKTIVGTFSTFRQVCCWLRSPSYSRNLVATLLTKYDSKRQAEILALANAGNKYAIKRIINASNSRVPRVARNALRTEANKPFKSCIRPPIISHSTETVVHFHPSTRIRVRSEQNKEKQERYLSRDENPILDPRSSTEEERPSLDPRSSTEEEGPSLDPIPPYNEANAISLDDIE